MAAQSFSFFYNHVVKKDYKTPSVLFPAHSSKLPAVLSKQQMILVFKQVRNLKHQTLLALLYSTGMRLSEIANLKIEDIDSKLMRIKIVSGKGNKDRFVQLSEIMLQQLRCYYKQYKPQLYLFNGYAKGKKYHTRSIQTVLHNALLKAGLQHKNFSIHSIRHSFATHLLDSGTDLHTIKELMGHSHLQQTTRYLHLSTKRIQHLINPLDALFVNNQ